MINYVKNHTTQEWANQFLRDIKLAHNQLESSLFLGLTSDVYKYRLISKKTMNKLDHKYLKETYTNTSNRLIFIDLKDMGSSDLDAFKLTQNLLKQLDVLSRFEENKIWVFSHDTKAHMEEKLSEFTRYTHSNTHKTGMSSK